MREHSQREAILRRKTRRRRDGGERDTQGSAWRVPRSRPHDKRFILGYTSPKSDEVPTLPQGRVKRTPPEPSTTRTDRDWVMMALGAGLILLFLIGGYMSYPLSDAPTVPKIKGPVKDPKKLGIPAPAGRNPGGSSTSWTRLRAFVVNSSEPAT